MKKRIGVYLVITIMCVCGFAGKVLGVSFPQTIEPSINYDQGYYGLLGTNEGWRLYAKETKSAGKALCTSFSKYAPNGGKCYATPWVNGNADMDARVAAMIGSVLYEARDDKSKGTMNWDNYYYAELVINQLLYNGYTSGRGYGSKENDISNLPASIRNSTKFQKYYSKGIYEYYNYGNTKVTIASGSYNKDSGIAKATVVCRDYTGKQISCGELYGSDKAQYTIEYTSNSGNKITKTGTNISINVNEISANIGANLDSGTIKFTAVDKKNWYTAKNYNCGDSYQSLTPNYLVEVKKSITKEYSITYDPDKYSLEIIKKEANTDKYLDGAVVRITKDGESFQDNIEITNGVYRINDLDAGTYCVTEITAPDGYVLDSNNHCVSIDENNRLEIVTITNQKEEKRAKLTINKIDEDKKPVVGAKISVKDLDCMMSKTEGSEDFSSCVIETFTTENTAKEINNLEVGKKYMVVEEELPKEGGYSGGITSVEITISEDNSRNVVTLTNNHSSIKISKQSVTSTKELPGAKLTITDAQGNVVANWTSSDKPQEIVGLFDGDYTLTETTAPQGYTVAESIKFTIEDGVVKGDDDNTVVMKDATIVEVPDTFNIQNIIAMISGIVLVGIGTGVLFYETKKKKA